MKRVSLIILMIGWLLSAGSFSISAKESGDTLTARDALLRMPIANIDILSRSMRLDMLGYYDADSIYKTRNAMDGLSELMPPLSDDYLKVKLTSASTIAIKVLESKSGQIFVSSYTVGSDSNSRDSELSFFDKYMRRVKTSKYLKEPELKDFLVDGLDSKTRETVLDQIPFLTVEYSFRPGEDTLTATLTISGYMGREEFEKVSPYLRKQLQYRWSGNKFEKNY
jgi:hypothetical protein